VLPGFAEDPPPELEDPPGTPGCTADGGGVPSGGALPGFWEAAQLWNALGVTTNAVERMNA